MKTFNPLRVLLLLLILLGVAVYIQGQRLFTTNWAQTLEVVIFPVNGDGSTASDAYIAGLGNADVAEVDTFLAKQAETYGIPVSRPFHTRIGPPVGALPPASPRPEDPKWQQLVWILKFRLWAWRHTPDDKSNYRRVRVFAVFHRPAGKDRLPHSLGVQKGLLGLVHLYAERELQPGNNVVMAHEILHTVGARDKYAEDGYPVFPDGFAEPNREPLFPQYQAELMAGTLALSEHESVAARSLTKCTIGPATAREIGWLTAAD